LTAKGGVSSHAALVARQMGKVCVCGASALQIDYTTKTCTVDGKTYKEGDYLSINGTLGNVYAGELPTAASEIVQVLVEKSLDGSKSETYQMFKKLMDWCSKVTRLQVRTNADTPEQTENALSFGATGIGLTRTEHMFFEGNRIDAMREMILATTVEARKKALDKLLPYQRSDFEGIFKAMQGRPVTIRTLDPPLPEFLPHQSEQQKELSNKIGVAVETIARRVQELHEANPMLGHRGCRLGIVYPEITEMQCRAIFEAACNVQKSGTKVEPEIMIPLVGFLAELKEQAKIAHETAKKVFAEKGVTVNYLVGTMIELPRACVAADQIAKEAQFFSFGTNDLTQTTLGMSRDDYGSFIRYYMEHDLVSRDPFQTIDTEGVGSLMKIGVEKGRGTRADLKVGICGEHGGDPDTVKFCHKIGLNYVSCSPFRVPIARLAAAQAALTK
jgi:pyruvate, orthophosphate dikinase